MRIKLVTVIFAALACTAICTPTNEVALSRHRRQVAALQNNTNELQKIISNLQNSAETALDAVQNYSLEIQTQMNNFTEDVVQKISEMKDSVTTAVNNINSKMTSAGATVSNCIAQQQNASKELFKQTLVNILKCGTDRIADISNKVKDLANKTKNVISYIKTVPQCMAACTQKNDTNISAATLCIGKLILEAQGVAAKFALESGLAIASLNTAFASLQSSLEMCATLRLVEAGICTAKIIANIGSCSFTSKASSIFSLG